MPAILEVRDLVKRYPGVTAVDGIQFAVQEGECFGLLGPQRRRQDHHRGDDGRHQRAELRPSALSRQAG